jgi:6-phosphogluconolactonase (cycloisomerase 2 family)
MISKPSRLALAGMAVLCATIFAACNCAPTLRYLVVAPNNGDIYVSASGDAIKGGAKRAPARSTRRAAASPLQLSPGAVCGSLQYAATGYYSDGTTQDQSSAVTWSSSSTSVATINGTGLASGVALGFTNIGATLASITATAVPLEVDQLNSITVNQPSPTLAVGQTQTDTATGSFTLAGGESTTQDISSQVTWAASNGNVTVDASGDVTGVTPGPVTITATSCDGITVGQVSMTVSGIALVVTPNTMTAAAGTTVQYVAMENNNGTLQPPGSAVTWSSSATTTASINATTGLAQALSASSTAVTITATEANPAIPIGTASLTVQAAAARFAYVANTNGFAGTGSISSYIVTVGGSTPLAPNTNDTTYPTGLVPVASNPQQVLLHPSGDLLFYIGSDGAVRSFFVNSTNGVFGSTPTTQSPAIATNAGGDLYTGVIDPTGRFLYVASQGNQVPANANGNGVIYGFTITHTQPSGGMNDAKLTPISGLAAPAGFNDGTINGPTWILTDQTGSYLYIINSTTNTVSEYAINQTPGSLGQLMALGNSPVDTTGGTDTNISPNIGRIDTNGHLFVANQGNVESGQSVTAFTITPSGTTAGELTMIGTTPTPVASSTDPISVIVNPNGIFLYVLDFGNGTGAGQVFTYGLTASSGVIGSAVGTAQTTDITPYGGMAIDPTGALLLIDNFGANDISLFTIGSNGAATPASPATVASGTNPEFIALYTAASGQ